MNKQLTIKEIESIKGLYEKLLTLDKEIIKLESIGQSLVSGEKRVVLEIKIEDLLVKQENIATEGGSLESIMTRGLLGFSLHMREQEVKYKTETITEEVNDVFTLELIAFLLNIKNKQRTAILNKFEN